MMWIVQFDGRIEVVVASADAGGWWLSLLAKADIFRVKEDDVGLGSLGSPGTTDLGGSRTIQTGSRV